MNDRLPRILIVDDDPADVEIMRILLREAGIRFTPEICEDGEQASNRLSAPRPGEPWPDLVLLDLNLPKKSGRDILPEIKANPETRDIPVIILTTAASPEEIAAFEAFPGTRCLIKPYVLREYGPIVATIRETLNRALASR